MNLKIIVGLLVGLIVIQIIGALVFFMLPTKSVVSTRVDAPAELSTSNTTERASLFLMVEREQIKRNDEVAVRVELDTRGRIVEGVDVSLRYDAGFLEPVLVNKVPFVPGRLFTEVPFNAYDSRIGVATMSAIMSVTQNYQGAGTLAVITFKAKKSGTTTISLQAEENNTIDSNVVSDGKEILGETKNVTLTIQ